MVIKYKLERTGIITGQFKIYPIDVHCWESEGFGSYMFITFHKKLKHSYKYS